MNTEKIILVNKPVGMTPLEIIKELKIKKTEYENETISYAGRLDPMAHGLLLLLVNDENKNREAYLHLKKTYVVDILFGFETDTYDILGRTLKAKQEKVDQEKIKKTLVNFVGEKDQLYPSYSSKAVKGKPLFWWARNNRLHEIEIPKRTIKIYSIDFLSGRKIFGKELLETIEEKIKKVSGDFRQESILADWQEAINVNSTYTSIKISVTCSSVPICDHLLMKLENSLAVEQ